MRIFELAQALKTTSGEVLRLARALDLDAHSTLSRLDDDDIQALKSHMAARPPEALREQDAAQARLAAKRERAIEVCERLNRRYGPVECFLDHENPFRLLIAVLLSAQTTDAQVNKVTPRLFAQWPTPEAMAGAMVKPGCWNCARIIPYLITASIGWASASIPKKNTKRQLRLFKR